MVKVNLRDNKGKVNELELDLDSKVEGLKVTIQEIYKVQNPEQIKLIFKGKLLNSDDLLSKYSILEGNTINLIILKSEEDKLKEDQTPENSKKIAELMELGFERDDVVKALRLANFNKEQASNYLFDGIPEINTGLMHQENNLEHSESQVDNIIEQFLLGPEYAEMRDQIRQDPSSIHGLIEQLGHASPQIYEALVSNPQVVEEIVEAINSFQESELNLEAMNNGDMFPEDDDDEDYEGEEYEDYENYGEGEDNDLDMDIDGDAENDPSKLTFWI